MGISSFSSKKASATLVFLIISILVVSSGAIIVYEVNKPDRGTGTGLVLLDVEQNNYGGLLATNEEIDAPMLTSSLSSHTSKDHTKSSLGSSSSSNDFSLNSNIDYLSLQDSNLGGLDSLNNTSSTNNEPDLNDTIINETNLSEDSSKGSAADGNCYPDSKETNEGPDGTYCMYEDYEECYDYKTKSTVIAWDCDLIPFGCHEEERGTDYCINSYTLNEAYLNCHIIAFSSDHVRWKEKNCNAFDHIGDWVYYCTSSNVRRHKYKWDYGCSDGACKVVWGGWVDDELVSKKGDNDYCSARKFYGCSLCEHNDYDCVYDSECSGSLECMGPGVLGCLLKECGCCKSGETWDKTRNKCCECSSGPCCDGCNYKTSGAEPTGYTDYYYCSGTNSPTTTSYCKKKDYYCSGNDANVHSSILTLDTCGTCAYCKEGYSSCFFYYQNEYCGTKDCDYLDVTCRNYHDVDRGCSGGGVCSNPSCNSYTNAEKGTSCGTNKECDGNGNCVTISIVCSSNSDCGTDGWVGSAFCSGDDVYQDYRTWTCNNAGTTSSTCTHVDTATLKQDCEEDYCEDWEDNYCYDNDVYHSRTCHDIGCSNGNCVDSTYGDKQKVQECGTAGCSNGACNIACFNDADCGTDKWVGSIFCLSDNIYQKWRTYTCDKPGTVDASCSYSDQNQKKQDCGTDCYVGNAFCKNNNVWKTWRNYICTSSVTQDAFCSYTDQTKEKEDCGSFSCGSWGTNYCKGEDVYHKRTCYYGGCSNGICYNNLNKEEQEAVVEICTNGCTEGRCKIEVCETVCSPTKCYEYCEWQ